MRRWHAPGVRPELDREAHRIVRPYYPPRSSRGHDNQDKELTMSLLRRLQKLESLAAPADPCKCATRPCWVRSANANGEFEPDVTPRRRQAIALCTARW